MEAVTPAQSRADLNQRQAAWAVELRQLRASTEPGAKERAKRIGELLIGSVEPILWRVVNSFRGRGIAEDDLFQEAALSVLLAVGHWNGAGDFGPLVELYARNAARRLIRRQGADVHLPDKYFDGHSSETPPEISVVSRDAKIEQIDGANTKKLEGRDLGRTDLVDLNSPYRKANPDAEQLFSDAEQAAVIRQALKELHPTEAEIIRRVYGIGREPISLRALAIEKNWSRTKLTAVHDAALKKLLTMLRAGSA